MKARKQKMGFAVREVLETLNEYEEGAYTEEVAADLEKNKANVAQVINRLRHEKLVARIDGFTGPGRRKAVYAITPAGVKALNKADDAAAA